MEDQSRTEAVCSDEEAVAESRMVKHRMGAEEGPDAVLDMLESHGVGPSAGDERGRERVPVPLPLPPKTLADRGGRAIAEEEVAVVAVVVRVA